MDLRSRNPHSLPSVVVAMAFALALTARAVGEPPQAPSGGPTSPVPKSRETASPAASPPSAAELVRRLGDAEFSRREAAAEQLIEMSGAAISALEAGARNNDREIRYRAQRLLATIRHDEFEQRLARFTREGDDAVGESLPSWPAFRDIVGNTVETRQLFVDMQRAEPDLLAALDEGRRDASREVNLRAARLQMDMQAYNREISVGSVASLLLAAGREDIDVTQQSASMIYSYCYQSSGVRGALEGGRYEREVRKLLGRWIARSDDSIALYQALVLATQYDLKEGLKPAERILRDGHQQPHVVQFAVLTVARLGDERHVPLVEPLVGDATHATQRRVGDDNRSVTVQVRDIALAALVHLTGQDYADYGFRHIQPNPQTVFTANSACFESDEDRDRALARWRDYRAGKLKTDEHKTDEHKTDERNTGGNHGAAQNNR